MSGLRLLTVITIALLAPLGARDASAAFVALVPTGQSATSHSYDLILDTEGEPVIAFEAFMSVAEVGCAACFLGGEATDQVSAVVGLVSTFTSLDGDGNVHWGGFDFTDHPPVAGLAIGTLRVDHIDTALLGAGRIEILFAANPPNAFVSSSTTLPDHTCPIPAQGCALAVIAPAPGALPLLGVGIAGLALARGRTRTSR